MTMTNVLFRDDVLNKIKEADDFHEFCRQFKCVECPFNGMHDCEHTFDAIKKELEK